MPRSRRAALKTHLKRPQPCLPPALATACLTFLRTFYPSLGAQGEKKRRSLARPGAWRRRSQMQPWLRCLCARVAKDAAAAPSAAASTTRWPTTTRSSPRRLAAAEELRAVLLRQVAEHAREHFGDAQFGKKWRTSVAWATSVEDAAYEEPFALWRSVLRRGLPVWASQWRGLALRAEPVACDTAEEAAVWLATATRPRRFACVLATDRFDADLLRPTLAALRGDDRLLVLAPADKALPRDVTRISHVQFAAGVPLELGGLGRCEWSGRRTVAVLDGFDDCWAGVGRLARLGGLDGLVLLCKSPTRTLLRATRRAEELLRLEAGHAAPRAAVWRRRQGGPEPPRESLPAGVVTSVPLRLAEGGRAVPYAAFVRALPPMQHVLSQLTRAYLDGETAGVDGADEELRLLLAEKLQAEHFYALGAALLRGLEVSVDTWRPLTELVASLASGRQRLLVVFGPACGRALMPADSVRVTAHRDLVRSWREDACAAVRVGAAAAGALWCGSTSGGPDASDKAWAFRSCGAVAAAALGRQLRRPTTAREASSKAERALLLELDRVAGFLGLGAVLAASRPDAGLLAMATRIVFVAECGRAVDARLVAGLPRCDAVVCTDGPPMPAAARLALRARCVGASETLRSSN
jgi:hypothetical protein